MIDSLVIIHSHGGRVSLAPLHRKINAYLLIVATCIGCLRHWIVGKRAVGCIIDERRHHTIGKN
jgi:hypothetical protein